MNHRNNRRLKEENAVKKSPRIVILASRGEKANILYHRLSETCQVEKVFLEESVPRGELLRRRIKKMGFKKVAGQILFKGLVAKPLEKSSRRRLQEIKENNHMSDAPIPTDVILEVSSVNDEQCIRELKTINPDLVVVNGTRIISREVLQSIDAPFLNMHAGITPLYRGVHGGYWALAEQDAQHCGVTVHLIDEGIDTGSVIYQSVIQVQPEDNFITYPYLQFALGLEDMVRAVEDFTGEGIHTKVVDLPSKFRTHPTFWEYLHYKRKYGVK